MVKKINVNVMGAGARGVSRWSGLGERRHGDGVHGWGWLRRDSHWAVAAVALERSEAAAVVRIGPRGGGEAK